MRVNFLSEAKVVSLCLPGEASLQFLTSQRAVAPSKSTLRSELQVLGPVRKCQYHWSVTSQKGSDLRSLSLDGFYLSFAFCRKDCSNLE